MRRIRKSPNEIIRLAEHYVASVAEPTRNAFWAWVRLGRLVHTLRSDQAFDLAWHIVDKLPARCLGSFGGGALAHLVQYHGEAVIDWLEKETRRQRRFLKALSGVCLATEEVNPFLLPRLQALTGDRIRVLPKADRDAAYREMLNRRVTGRRSRRVPSRGSHKHTPALELVRNAEHVSPRKPRSRG